MDNIIQDAKKDVKLQPLADIIKKMGEGETWVGEYTYGGANKYVAYALVKGTGWSVGITVQDKEIFSELNSLKASVMLTSILFIVIGVAVVYIVVNNISNGIKSTEGIDKDKQAILGRVDGISSGSIEVSASS